MTERAILIPVDNRPVTYVFPQLIGALAGVETLLPPRTAMGSLKEPTNIDSLWDWLIHTLQRLQPEAVIVSLDTLLYGGLIPSRRSDLKLNDVLAQAKSISKWKNVRATAPSVFAQSSIMRISDNYDNTEEKQYWARFGREIFAWSESLHRLQKGSGQRGELERLEARIPQEIRQDYLDTRRRNFQVNKNLIEFASSGAIDFLVFSQDDSGEFGLNVSEKERLIADAEERKATNVTAYAGADEVLMTLLARWLIHSSAQKPQAKLIYGAAGGPTIPSRYEGQTIGDTLRTQMNAADIRLFGADATGKEAGGKSGANGTPEASAKPDFTIIVHTGSDRQGDHIWLPGLPDMRQVNTQESVAATMRALAEADTPVVLCDVAYANGSDPALVEELLKNKTLLKKLWGYAGWNTTGNTVGSALAMGVAAWYASRQGTGMLSSKQLAATLFVRFADDWAYQTQVRKELGDTLGQERLKELMKPYLERISSALEYSPGAVNVSLPWDRSFEVEVSLPTPGMPLPTT